MRPLASAALLVPRHPSPHPAPTRTTTAATAVAHRLHTIIDSDRVAVMSEGRVAEFDTAAALLREGAAPRGIFAELVRETGPKTEAALRQAAGVAMG